MQVRTSDEEIKMRRLGARWLHEELGQDLIEYALLASSLSVIVIAVLEGLGLGVNALWDGIEAGVRTIPPNAGS